MSEKTFSATRWAAVTPSDTARLEPFPVAVFVGGAGDIVAKGSDGVSATFAASAGQMLFIQPQHVMATGTTATGIVALFNT